MHRAKRTKLWRSQRIRYRSNCPDPVLWLSQLRCSQLLDTSDENVPAPSTFSPQSFSDPEEGTSKRPVTDSHVGRVSHLKRKGSLDDTQSDDTKRRKSDSSDSSGSEPNTFTRTRPTRLATRRMRPRPKQGLFNALSLNSTCLLGQRVRSISEHLTGDVQKFGHWASFCMGTFK